MTRTLSTHELAAQLGVSEKTIRYHARRGAFPYDETPGGHRRYDLEEVRAALGSARGNILATETAFAGRRLNLSLPSGQLTPTMAMQLQATAAYDEQRFEQPSERMTPGGLMEPFAVPGSARYPQPSPALGAGA